MAVNQSYLTNKEFEVMKAIWKLNKPVTTADILNSVVDKVWSEGSLYPIINSLVKKKYIIVTGKRKAVKTNSRVFEAAISETKYSANQINEIFKGSHNQFSLKNLINYLSKDTINKNNIIDELEDWFKDNNIK